MVTPVTPPTESHSPARPFGNAALTVSLPCTPDWPDMHAEATTGIPLGIDSPSTADEVPVTAVTTDRGLLSWHFSQWGHIGPRPQSQLGTPPVGPQSVEPKPAFLPGPLPPFPPLLYK